MLIGLITSKVEEKKQEKQASRGPSREEVYGAQASGQMRDDNRRLEERRLADWREDDRRLDEREREEASSWREGEHQANGRMRMDDAVEQPPTYDETVRPRSTEKGSRR